MRATRHTLRLPYTCLSLDHACHVRRGRGRRLAGEALRCPETIAVFTLFVPFACYLPAEHLGFSGVLAAWLAGVTRARGVLCAH